MKARILFLAAIAAMTGVPAQAGIALETKIFRTEATKLASGATTERLVPAQRAVPGDPMVYVLAYRNTGTQPVADIMLDSPVPPSMIYRGAGAGAEPEVSIDGSRFGRLADLSITGPGGVRRPARLSDVVHVRWRVVAPVQPGAGGEVSFHAALR
ncbi:hypothetical protein [Rhizorhabdus dicambivorans]|uniref:DUF11 domain-containing protein n=1 Tax=Rhizorhabdus dicambivorans TaxID=1850238 RepID=A0A2A4FST6_9SPHN|nr:hypothetical protein [Rhizorhabdus dicambivorans]ATE64633.1 hypothetical protein CMV14_09625 [Rhizorhabdus dicambivorans]PCE40754.1 hypothetical protein COO09_18735 [Rhizorhabdus dicambivorans]